MKHKTHIDTVLGRRERYLESFQRKENSANFLKYQGNVEIDWEKIDAKIAAEQETERSRPGAKPYA